MGFLMNWRCIARVVRHLPYGFVVLTGVRSSVDLAATRPLELRPSGG
jgi:hypothetical protein